MATPAEEILSWTKKQPAWRQDAMRRILTKIFTSSDENECLELLKLEHGFSITGIKADPLDKKHLPTHSSSATSLRLIGVDEIANVNRLSKDAALTLSPNGVTLIYGGNGSGKSGYTRILKKACRSRHDEDILPNIFAITTGAHANARFTVQEGTGSPAQIAWADDGTPPADILGRLAIFDSKCASVHVDGQNSLEVVPHNLDCFEKLAVVCDRLRARLKTECENLEKQLVGALIAPPTGTNSAFFISQLDKKTEADLANAAKWESQDEKRLGELGGILQDPISEAQRLERLATALREYADGLAAASLVLDDKSVVEIDKLRHAATDFRAAANASAAAAFSAEALKGVGEQPWRLLFDAARGYSEQHAYPGQVFPVTGVDSKCVLCQQPLDKAARERFERFVQFVTSAMNSKAINAEALRDAALLRIRPINLPINDVPSEARDHLEQRLPQLLKDSVAYRNGLVERRLNLLQNKNQFQPLSANPDLCLRGEIDSLTAAAQEARELANNSAGLAEALRKEHEELKGKKILFENYIELKRRIGLHRQIVKIEECIKACATKDISDHGSKLLKVYVTEELSKALANEQENLQLKSIPLRLSDRTSKAVIQHQLKFNGATLEADTSAVLSEGEHRAVALAAFLSELKMYPGSDAIIIDDPVSSLDHERKSRVAERLVVEGKNRQVIIFTHDLVFVAEVRFFAGKHQVPLSVVGIRRSANGFGAPDPDGEPWVAKALSGRRVWLTKQLSILKGLHKDSNPEYEIQLRYFYDRLRESWEKLVEERIFAQVISRFQPQVQTMRLKQAVIDDEIVTQIHFGMTAVSSYTGHDRAPAKGGELAEPSECEHDLTDFIVCVEGVDAKSKAAVKDREPKLTAPKPK